jgi:hypothetical protein
MNNRPPAAPASDCAKLEVQIEFVFWWDPGEKDKGGLPENTATDYAAFVVFVDVLATQRITSASSWSLPLQ